MAEGIGPIRQWAQAQGIVVGSRGLIPREIVEQYKRYHGISDASVFPMPPPKPRIMSGADCWIVDTGYVSVLLDTWPDALKYAAEIRSDYVAGLELWLAHHRRETHADRG